MSPRHARAAPAAAHVATPIKREPASAPATPAPSPSLSPAPSSSSAASSPATPPPPPAWQLIPYDVPWGADFADYAAGTLPGPAGACLFLRSPTPVEKRRAAQACEPCRERKAKCSGDRPACLRCIEKGYECAYAAEQRRPTAPLPARRKATTSTTAAYAYRPYPQGKPRPRPEASTSASASPPAGTRSLKREEPVDVCSWSPTELVSGSYDAYTHTIHAPTPRRAALLPAPDVPTASAAIATAAAAATAGFACAQSTSPGRTQRACGEYVDVDVDTSASASASSSNFTEPYVYTSAEPTYAPAHAPSPTPVVAHGYGYDYGYNDAYAAYSPAAAPEHYTAGYATPISDYSTPTSDYSTPTSDYSTPTSDYSTPTSDYSTPISSFSTLAHALHYPYDVDVPRARGACVPVC